MAVLKKLWFCWEYCADHDLARSLSNWKVKHVSKKNPECDDPAVNPGMCSQLAVFSAHYAVWFWHVTVVTFSPPSLPPSLPSLPWPPFQSISWWLSNDLRQWTVWSRQAWLLHTRVCDFSPVWDVLHFFTFTYALLTGCLKVGLFVAGHGEKLVGEPSHCWLIKTCDIITDDDALEMLLYSNNYALGERVGTVENYYPKNWTDLPLPPSDWCTCFKPLLWKQPNENTGSTPPALLGLEHSGLSKHSIVKHCVWLYKMPTLIIKWQLGLCGDFPNN